RERALLCHRQSSTRMRFASKLTRPCRRERLGPYDRPVHERLEQPKGLSILSRRGRPEAQVGAPALRRRCLPPVTRRLGAICAPPSVPAPLMPASTRRDEIEEAVDQSVGRGQRQLDHRGGGGGDGNGVGAGGREVVLVAIAT